ncbi:MAG: hypothetical protein ACOZDY_13715 [Pseudomonadota bacterium]
MNAEHDRRYAQSRPAAPAAGALARLGGRGFGGGCVPPPALLHRATRIRVAAF